MLVQQIVSSRPPLNSMSQNMRRRTAKSAKVQNEHATIQRLQRNLPGSTAMLNRLCRTLDCRLENIAAYVPERTEFLQSPK